MSLPNFCKIYCQGILISATPPCNLNHNFVNLMNLIIVNVAILTDQTRFPIRVKNVDN